MMLLEDKIDILSKMLSGYDLDTWKKLKVDRRRAYVRAATVLIHDWNNFQNFMSKVDSDAAERS